MIENKYWVKLDDTVVSENMTLEMAILLVRAIFETYYNDLSMVISMSIMERAEEKE